MPSERLFLTSFSVARLMLYLVFQYEWLGVGCASHSQTNGFGDWRQRISCPKVFGSVKLDMVYRSLKSNHTPFFAILVSSPWKRRTFMTGQFKNKLSNVAVIVDRLDSVLCILPKAVIDPRHG